MIRVLVVDDHAVVRSGLRRVLDAEDDIETVGEAPDAERAVFEVLEQKPDVVLLDVVMPGKSGIEIIPTLRQNAPEVKVLVLSMQDDPHYVREAFEAGASGYVLKEAADTEVVDAVRAVAAGERYVHPALGARLVQAEAEERRRAEEDPLSDREREVLRLLALGHTNQEIAKTLFISVRTAETHRAHIMQKLGLSSRAELVRYALERGAARGLTLERGCNLPGPRRDLAVVPVVALLRPQREDEGPLAAVEHAPVEPAREEAVLLRPGRLDHLVDLYGVVAVGRAGWPMGPLLKSHVGRSASSPACSFTKARAFASQRPT